MTKKRKKILIGAALALTFGIPFYFIGPLWVLDTGIAYGGSGVPSLNKRGGGARYSIRARMLPGTKITEAIVRGKSFKVTMNAPRKPLKGPTPKGRFVNFSVPSISASNKVKLCGNVLGLPFTRHITIPQKKVRIPSGMRR